MALSFILTQHPGILEVDVVYTNFSVSCECLMSTYSSKVSYTKTTTVYTGIHSDTLKILHETLPSKLAQVYSAFQQQKYAYSHYTNLKARLFHWV